MVSKWRACLAAAAVIGSVSSAASAATYTSPVGPTTLYPNDSIVSRSGNARLTYGIDGNLVLYYNGKAKWATDTVATYPTQPLPYQIDRVVFQTDGNLVNYWKTTPKPTNGVVWNSKSANKGGTTLEVQDDGNLVIYTSSRAAIWSCCN